MQNQVEYHIRQDSEETFKVNAGEVLYIGDVVELKGDMTVGAAAADSEKVVGVVTGGTVGNIGYRNPAGNLVGQVGFSGDRKEVVNVLLNGHMIYAQVAGSPTVGAKVAAGAAGTYKVADPTKLESVFGLVLSVATKVAGRSIILFRGR